MLTVQLLLPALAFLSVTGLVGGALAMLAGADRRVAHRLRSLRGHQSQDATPVESGGQVQRWLLRLTHPFLSQDPAARASLRNRLAAAGLGGPLAGHVYLAARGVLLLALLAPVLMAKFAGWLSSSDAWIATAIAFCLSVLLPAAWLARRRARRHVHLLRAWPDFLDLLVTCVESGLSLDAAIRRVTSEIRFVHPLLAAEMDRVQKEIELGETPDGALQHLAGRCGVDSVRSLASLMQQSRRFGGSVTDALHSHSDQLRDQRELQAEERAQKAAMKILMPTLLLIFPAVFVVVAGPAVIQLSEKLTARAER